MLNDDLEALLKAEPFLPFVIRTAGGRELPVRHPEFLYRLPTGRTIIVAQEGGAYDIVDMILVEGVRVEAPRERPGGGNGRPDEDSEGD